MSIVKRYHEPVRRAFRIMQKECPDISFEVALQMTVRSVNDSVEPDGISPILAAHGTIGPFDLPAIDHPY